MKATEKNVRLIDWAARSRKGEVCGILGCFIKPIRKCPHCGNYYCEEHSVVIDSVAHNWGRKP